MTDISYPLAGRNDGGQWAGTDADVALWLRLFGGEVLAAFEKQIEVAPRIMTRTIPHGRSSSFPIHGRA